MTSPSDDMTTVSPAPGFRAATRGRVEGGRYVPPGPAPRAGHALGDVLIDATYVRTPVGDMRRDQTRWTVGATVPGPSQIPMWATLCAVFLFLCIGPFSLLFLLAKETEGEMTTVHLTDGKLTYITKIYTCDQAGYQLILQTIEWAERALPERRAIGG